MAKRAWLVGRIAVCAPILAMVAASCGGSDGSGSSAGPGSDGGGGGDDGSLFGDGGGGDDGGGAASGTPTTCIVGTKGCLCDSSGGCAPGLTCTPQTAPRPSVCCNGADCAPSGGGSIGKTCNTVSGAPSCTPGITVPAASGGNDSCGYPTTDFIESTTLCAINAVGGGGTAPAVIQIFYNDEHALTLGCDTPSHPVSPLTSNPEALHYPETGDPACTDTLGRPLRPVLYVTDISVDSSCNAGDMQKGGPAYDPIAVFGTWKKADEVNDDGGVGTPDKTDPTQNKWNLTSSADPVPQKALSCTEGFGAELRFEVGLISGHSYRLQVIVHDGDQTKGGDSGEACAVFCAGTGTLCSPGVTVCADGTACPNGTVCVQGCCLNAVK